MLWVSRWVLFGCRSVQCVAVVRIRLTKNLPRNVDNGGCSTSVVAQYSSGNF